MAKWLKLYAIYIYIFHLTWLLSLHYLVKGGCSKFLPNTGFVTIRLLRFGVKVKRAYTCDNFLAQRPLPDIRALSGDDFFMFQQDGTSTHQHATLSLFWSVDRDARNASSSGACVRERGAHFKPEFWQFWAHLSRQLITLLNKPYSVYWVLIQSSDTLLQTIHFNVIENIWVSQGKAVTWVRLGGNYLQHTILATLPSTYQNLLKFVEILLLQKWTYHELRTVKPDK